MSDLKKDISSEPFVSSYTFRYYSDHGWMSRGDGNKFITQLPNGIHPEKVKEGDTIYVVTEFLDRYFNEINPKIKVPYTLITSRCDRGCKDSDAKKMTDNIIHWYTHNNTSTHDRITTIPLGLQNKHWKVNNHPQSNSDLILKISEENLDTKKNVLITFRTKTNRGEREKCYNYFKDKPFSTMRGFNENHRTDINFVSDYFREIKRHKFVVCPFGGGWDCHRNWETFSLGGIPIIKKHKSMEMFYDMSAWFINDWNEVNEDSINKKYNEMKENWNSFNHDKKYFEYWRKLIWQKG